MLEDFPVEVIEYCLSEDEKHCQKCDKILHEMSKEIRRELQIIPAQVKVIGHVRYIYACCNCEENDIETLIIAAKMPVPVLSGSFVSPSLISMGVV